MKKNEILEAYNYRHACKKYDKNKVVSDEDFNTILETGRLSPSSFGVEPWKFLLLKNEKMKEDFREFAMGAINSINGASHILIVLARKGVTAESEYFNHIVKDVYGMDDEIVKGRKEFFGAFQAGYLNLLENERTLFDWASKQTYIVLGNMMTTAAMLGIDSCAIEGFEKEKTEKYLEEKGILDREKFGVSYLVSFGYRAETPFPKKRQKLSDIYEVIE